MSKPNQNAKPRSMEEMIGNLSAQLDLISSQLQHANKRLDEQEARFSKLEKMLTASHEENSSLKEIILNKDSEIKQLKVKLNDVEQHQRSFCVRIFGMHLDGDERDNSNVAHQVYQNLLLPILNGAQSKGRIDSIPSVNQLLETAHILPGKADKAKPIICRFYNRFYRTIILQLRKEFAPRAPARGNSRHEPYLYPMYEDVTGDTFRMMRALSSNERVKACWSSGGQLRVKLVDSEIIHRVKCVYDTVEAILESFQ
jgi:hypothetical protein